MDLEAKFKLLQAENAPGQEVRQTSTNLDGLMQGQLLPGQPVDFSHGDVNAFPPTPGSSEAWQKGFEIGGDQAYTEYRGTLNIRESLAPRLEAFTGAPISAESELIITPGTQGALFLALGACVENQTKVAIVEPDYFANRKTVIFLGGTIVPIPLNTLSNDQQKGIDLNLLESEFKNGVEVFVFSNPNNPTGYIYTPQELQSIATLATKYNVTLIVDQLYSRLIYDGGTFTHLRSLPNAPENTITLMGPSKTESLSGFRLGTAFGSSEIIERMERLQAIVSLRAAGYNQMALQTWFNEPESWLNDRIKAHQRIRNDLITLFKDFDVPCAIPQGGSYLFPKLPALSVNQLEFVRLLRRQANVIVTPGTEFGPQFTDSIRLNFSQNHENAVNAVARIMSMATIYEA